jgi:hypothetical protein
MTVLSARKTSSTPPPTLRIPHRTLALPSPIPTPPVIAVLYKNLFGELFYFRLNLFPPSGYFLVV